MARDMVWVQKLSDQEEEARAKAQSQLQSAVEGQVEDEEDGFDFEAYPWQFKRDYGPEPGKMRALVQSLIREPGAKELPRIGA